jgi:hypothetical protein
MKENEHREIDVLTHLRNQLQILQKLENKINDTVNSKLNSIEEDIEELTDEIKTTKILINNINENQNEVLIGIKTIISTLGTPQLEPVLQIQFGGDTTMAGGNISKGQTIAASGIETDAFGKPVTIDPKNSSWSIDDSTIASFVQNADGSATFTPLATGSTIVRLTDNATSTVGTNTLTVSGGPDVLTLTFGDPQAATPA